MDSPDVAQVQPSGTGAVFSISEAATACRVSRNTIRRRLDEKAFPTAYKAGDGSWRIPVGDLEAAGLHPNRADPVVEIPDAEPDRSELDQIRAELELERERRLRAEAIAHERAERIEDLRMALRMLPAVGQTTRVRWWRRKAPDEG